MKLNSSFRVIYILMTIFLLAACKADQQPTPAPTTSQTASEIVTEIPEPTATKDEFVDIPDGDKISEIQGAGHISPYEGLEVQNVFGIVTVKRADGFYMQDPNPDSDIATSEGIFVLTRRIPKVERGDAVLVNGKVDEFNPAGAGANSLTITQITLPEYEVLSTGNAIPEATIIGIGGRTQPTEVIENDVDGSAASTGVFDPEEDGLDFYESLESMLIQVNDAVAVSSTSKYNEIAVVPDRGANAGVLSVRGGIILQETDQNPERIILDDTLTMLPSVQVGDIFIEPIIGVLDYTYGNFKLQPIAKLKFEPGGLEEEIPAAEISETQIAIATYNVENLDAEDNPKRLQELAHHIVDLMRSPDIIGLQEIQDNDGMLDTQSTAADQTYQLIIDAISVAGGPEYHFLNIDPVRHMDGGAPGGNIRVGILYRTDRGLTFSGGTPGDAETAVKIINSGGNPSLSLNPGRIDPQNLAFFDSRKPLVAEFTFNGQALFVVVNHFNSKGGDGALYGDIQPPFLESEIQRTTQAQVVKLFVEDLLAVDPNANIIVMGDMNDFPWSLPMKTLGGDVLVNLVSTLAINEQYTYIYDGNSQVLDQIFASKNLFAALESVNILHVNCEFYYRDRLSDHDPVLVVFDFK